MTYRTHTAATFAFLLRAMLASLALVVITSAAYAQKTIAWNPPCPDVKVVNASSRTFNGVINTTPAGLIPATPIAAGASNTYTMPLGSTVDNVTTTYGNTYPFVSTGLNVWTVTAITQGPPDWCVDVIADLNNCTITIVDSNGPWPCRD